MNAGSFPGRLLQKRNPVPIGDFKIQNIDWISRIGETGHDVFKDQRNKGYGYKIEEAGVDFCFEILNLHRIECEILQNNYASLLNVYKAGFSKEGNKRKTIYKNGIYLDSVVLGLLKEEWENLDRIKVYKGCCNESYYLRRKNGNNKTEN